MEEYNEDASQDAFANNKPSEGKPKKQEIPGKKTIKKKASAVVPTPAQSTVQETVNNALKKAAKKAVPKTVGEIKAETVEPKAAKIKKETSENKASNAGEQQPKIKKRASTKKASTQKTSKSTKDIVVIDPAEEQQQQVTGEHSITILPKETQPEEVKSSGAQEEFASADIGTPKEADPDFTPATTPDPVPAIAPVNQEELPLASEPQDAETISFSDTIQTADSATSNPVQEPESEHESAPVETHSNSPELNPANVSSIQKITFQIRYHTSPGQSLYVTGNHPLLGENNVEQAFPLNYLNDQFWSGTLEIPSGQEFSQDISYNYIVKNADGTTIREWADNKIIQAFAYPAKELLLIDSWNASFFAENTFYTEPFQQVLLKGNFTEADNKTLQNVTHIFKVKTPLLSKGQTLCIVGSSVELGQWDTESPLLLSRNDQDIWYKAEINLSAADFFIEYKYGVFDINASQFIRFEYGPNRVLNDKVEQEKLTVISDGFAILQDNTFRGAGVAIPVFSLRSEKSFGVGEFTDLKLLVDWAKQAGLKLIQLLPVNDTTATHEYTDSYPYAAISAFALHPLYLHLPALAEENNNDLLISLQDKQVELNSKPEVDYVGVMAEKWKFIKQIFPSKKQETFNNPDFKSFFDENAHWLIPYAAFSYLREKYNTSDFNQWPTNQTFNAEEIKAIASSPLDDQDDVSMYYYVQYRLHLQLKDATNYAHANGIIVKGDIPIGIYRNSCDAWQEPRLFNMDMQAGAPPDDFAVKGQNWGFPTYNWQKMRENGFSWWKKRFKQMSYYFDAFRIDHILGFFRIWSIPMKSVEGIMGHFVPAVPVHIDEFTGRGISFDVERLTKPFINDSVLSEFFGDDVELVINTFLQSSLNGNYSLKSEFDTQRKVEEHFTSLENTPENSKLKSGLFDLISNVILFEADSSDGQAYHFRIAMDTIPSFRHLDGHTQYVLKDLYVNYFYRRQDNFWMKEAMLKLPELKRSTNMLICGEDLGMVPACVPGVMRELAILSLEIQRMPKDVTREFFHPNDAPYLSVVTPSTHDMSTIRGWWEEDRTATQRFFNNELGQWGTAPYFCEPWINKIIILQHLYSPAMWSIFQLQDLLGIDGELRRENPHDERINVPADPKHYWRYRMHLTLEQLLDTKEFTSELRSYTEQSGR